MRSQRPALSGPPHIIWHVIVVLFGWCLFGGFWWLVLLQESLTLSNIIWLLASSLILLPAITLYWVLHNRGIYARKGPRRQAQVVEAAYTQDWAGRSVYAQFDRLKQARRITIHSTADEKHFLMPPGRPQPQAKAA